MSDYQDFLGRSLKLPDIDFLKEGQMSGAISARVSQLYEMLNETNEMANAPISVDPGDHIRIGDDQTPGIALTLPIAYDVWYLWSTVNILPANDDERTLFVDLILKPLLDRFGKLSILKIIQKESLASGGILDISFFQNNGVNYLKEMRFETFLKDRAIKYVSPGPPRITETGRDLENMGAGDIYSGYLAFPIGPLGVMEDVYLVSDSILDWVESQGQVYDETYDAIPGTSMLPPVESLSIQCKGLPVFEKAYLSGNNNVEYPAQIMEGQETVSPHNWVRYWLDKENVFPIPGELVCLSVKPLSVPPHCWWYQETTPFLYSGNWFETDYYTSGIVLAVIEEVDRDNEASTVTYEVTEVSTKYDQQQGHDEYQLTKGEQFVWESENVGNIYKIRVKDQDLYLKSSDFLRYAIDTRVAVRKKPGINKENFTWNDLEPGRRIPGETVTDIMDYDNSMSGKLFEINTSWSIVPITFYEQ